LGNGTTSLVWFEGKVGTYKGRNYSAVNIPKNGLVVPLTDGSAAKIYGNSNVAEIFRRPTISVSGQDNMNLSAGLAHGAASALAGGSPVGQRWWIGLLIKWGRGE
jgi:hypothetical protein